MSRQIPEAKDYPFQVLREFFSDNLSDSFDPRALLKITAYCGAQFRAGVDSFD